MRLILICGLLLAAGGPQAGPTPGRVHPVMLDRGQIAGSVFDDFDPVSRTERSELGEFVTEDVERYISPDRKFDFGMYRAGPNRYTIDEPYGVDEFMYFVEGGVKLTSADGTVHLIRSGDAVLIPRDWTGVWETEGYTKIYAIYSPLKPIE